jgi:putative hydrolases of HD superfamily
MVSENKAFEYEKNHGMTSLQPFFDSSLPNIRHPEVKQWSSDLESEREHHRRK